MLSRFLFQFVLHQPTRRWLLSEPRLLLPLQPVLVFWVGRRPRHCRRRADPSRRRLARLPVLLPNSHWQVLESDPSRCLNYLAFPSRRLLPELVLERPVQQELLRCRRIADLGPVVPNRLPPLEV